MPGLLRLLLALALMAGWTALLLLPALQPRGVGAAGFWDVNTLRAARSSLGRAILDLAQEALVLAPLGFLAVFAFRDRALRLTRAALVGLPAFALALAAAAAAVWLRDRAAGPPGPSDLLLPALGVLAGVLLGLALRRGLGALLMLPVKVLAALVLLLVVGLGLLVSSLEREAAVPEPPMVSTADRRRVVAVFRGKDPRSIPEGELRTLRLEQEDLDRLVAWGLPLVQGPEHARAAVALEANDTVGLRLSARAPRLGRWINLSAGARLGVEEGRFFLREPRLSVGRFAVPTRLMDALSPALAAAVRAERRLRPVLAALRELRVERGVAVATYGRTQMPRGLVASLVWGEGESAGLREAVAEQVETVLAALAKAPAGDTRTARAYEAAFRLARQRSQEARAVEANRAAILALGIVLGSGQLSPVVADPANEEQRARAAELRAGATLRGRADWTRHFSLSSALTVLSAVAPSNAAGLLKEELDADGGSGFSFGDLLADRAGTTFGAQATVDEAHAAAFQQRIVGGFEVAAFFPEARDLPEKIPDLELRARYGGVGGPLFRRYAG
ncbi:MAG TPA: hypothetical protein VEQ10_14775, partial [Vicinamibacteria bacterium]|nr:hypothetical protein [Vicinamibacteria bacterium]